MTTKHKLSKMIKDLQQGSEDFGSLQAEVDLLIEQSKVVSDRVTSSNDKALIDEITPAITTARQQGQRVLEGFSALTRNHFGSYLRSNGIIGHTDVLDDMSPDSVAGGGNAPTGAGGKTGTGGEDSNQHKLAVAALDKLKRIEEIVQEKS